MKSPAPKIKRVSRRALAISGLILVLIPAWLTPIIARAQVLSAVPTAEVPILPVGAATIAQQLKDIADVAATGLIKAAINVARDTVIRWIVTGRFSGPVFSKSFSLDLKKAAELASRNFLTQLSGINFCDRNIPIPPSAFLDLSLELALACRFNGQFLPFQQGRVADFFSLSSSEQTANDYWNNTMARLDRKLQEEARAKLGFAEEYRAGQGFLGIRDQVTGLITKPGSYVKKLVEETKIVSPQRQVDVANTVQQAIDAIITTAIQASVNRGLDAIFGESGGGGESRILPLPDTGPILAKIATLTQGATAFLNTVVPTAAVEGVRGITPPEEANIRNMITSLSALQVSLTATSDRETILRISGDVDVLEARLRAAALSTRYCAIFAPSAPICPRAVP